MGGRRLTVKNRLTEPNVLLLVEHSMIFGLEHHLGDPYTGCRIYHTHVRAGSCANFALSATTLEGQWLKLRDSHIASCVEGAAGSAARSTLLGHCDARNCVGEVVCYGNIPTSVHPLKPLYMKVGGL